MSAGARELARAISDRTKEIQKSNGQRVEYGVVTKADPLAIALTSSTMVLDKNDLVIDSATKNFSPEVGETVLLASMEDGDWATLGLVTPRNVPFDSIVAGDGLTRTGDTLNVGAGDGVTVTANSVTVDSTVARKNIDNNFSVDQTFEGIDAQDSVFGDGTNRLVVGDVISVAGYAGLRYDGLAEAIGNYGFLQSATATILNTPTGGTVSFRINNSGAVGFNASEALFGVPIRSDNGAAVQLGRNYAKASQQEFIQFYNATDSGATYDWTLYRPGVSRDLRFYSSGGAGDGLRLIQSNSRVEIPQGLNANLPMNSNKLTGLAAGTTAGDSVRYEQLPSSLPPSGAAGGALDGTYPSPGLAASVAGDGLTETADVLAVGAGTGITVAANTVGIDTAVVPRLGVANTWAAAQAMGGNKITGLAAGTTAGDALRYEQVIGVYPTSGDITSAVSAHESDTTAVHGIANTAVLATTGANTFTANQAMGGFKFTGLGAGTTNGDSLRYEQVVGTYALLASPTFTGTVTIPTAAITTLSGTPNFSGAATGQTAAVDTNTTQLATTAYVVGNGYLKSATAASTYAPLASPTFTGTVTIPTAAVTTLSGTPNFSGAATGQTAASNTNTTQLATTAYVQTELGDLPGNGLTISSGVLAVGASTGITVNANDVAIDTAVVPRLAVANVFTDTQEIRHASSMLRLSNAGGTLRIGFQISGSSGQIAFTDPTGGTGTDTFLTRATGATPQLELIGRFKTDGYVGFNNQAPAAPPNWSTTGGHTTNRAPASGDGATAVGNALMTLVDDLVAIGLLS